LNFGNYARPEYPPLSTMMFLVFRWIYESIFNVVWKINIAVSIFPSNFVTWFDKYGYFSLLKLPGILGDIGIGYLIYKYTREKLISYFYLFNPGVIYLSALWGQTESAVAFFALAGLMLLLRKILKETILIILHLENTMVLKFISLGFVLQKILILEMRLSNLKSILINIINILREK